MGRIFYFKLGCFANCACTFTSQVEIICRSLDDLKLSDKLQARSNPVVLQRVKMRYDIRPAKGKLA